MFITLPFNYFSSDNYLIPKVQLVLQYSRAEYKDLKSTKLEIYNLSHPNRNKRLAKNRRNLCQSGKGEIVAAAYPTGYCGFGSANQFGEVFLRQATAM